MRDCTWSLMWKILSARPGGRYRNSCTDGTGTGSVRNRTGCLHFQKVFLYILIGVGIGAFIHNWIPESWIEAVLGGSNPFGVIFATLVGIPMYADIFGTIPVAEALLYKGAQLGTILAFMMAVTTLSLPSLIMLRKAVKPKLWPCLSVSVPSELSLSVTCLICSSLY